MEYSNKIIEDILLKFKWAMRADYEKNKSHVCRFFLNCPLIDCEKKEEKYAIASILHDIGIWINHTFSYLQPLIDKAKIYLAVINKAD